MPLEEISSGIKLHCRLTPRSGADRVAGLFETQSGQALRCAVRAVPEKGKANMALEKLIAAWLDVPRSSVSVITGSKSRYKTLEIVGDSASLALSAKALITELGQGNKIKPGKR